MTGEPDDPEVRELARIFRNDYARYMHQRLPGSMTDGREVFLSVVLVVRKHLPTGYITDGGFYLPVFVHRSTPAVVIVPSRYWPQWLLDRWQPAAL